MLRQIFRRGAGLFLGTLMLANQPAQAQTAASTSALAGRPSLSGVWSTQAYVGGLRPIDGHPVPLTAEGRRRFAKGKAAVAADKAKDTARFICLPQGPARAMTTAYPFRIFQTDKLVVLLFEENRIFQRVRIDGAFHDPEGWDPSFMGDSIGKWEGRTLVIRTRNFREEMVLDDGLLPAGDKTEVEQRLTPSADGRRLDIVVTIRDASLYTRPWSAKLSVETRPDLEVETGDWVCGEPHRDISSIAGLASAPASHPSRGATRAPTAVPIHGKALLLTPGQAKLGGIWSMLSAGLTPPPPPAPPAPGQPVVRPTDSLFPPSLTKLLMPWNRKPYEEKLAKMRAGTLFPTPDNSCLPFLVPETAAYYGPYEMLFNDDMILMLFQADHQSRLVYMNIDLPAVLPLSFTGTSVGRFDGDTLVVTSGGWNDRSLVKQVVLHSDALRITERSSLSSDGQRLIVATKFEDAGALTGAWQAERRPARDDEDYQEYVNGEVSEYFPCPTADTGSTFPRLQKTAATAAK